MEIFQPKIRFFRSNTKRYSTEDCVSCMCSYFSHFHSKLQKYSQNIIGGHEQANLVIGFHGGCSDPIRVAEENFQNLKEKKIDSGWFGNGTYFTQFIGYGDKYSRFRQTFFSGKIPLIMSFAMLGNPFPVTERMDQSKLVEGYDSHYVLLKQSKGKMSYLPLESADEIPDYDEIVIFNPDQILPRYLLFIDQKSNSESEKYRTILWVEPNSRRNTNIIQSIEKHRMKVVTKESSQDAMEWLAVMSSHKYFHANNLRIITTSFQKDQNDESAGISNFTRFTF